MRDYILKFQDDNRGITLIEIITSIGLIGILLILVITIFTGSALNIRRAGNRTKHVLEAQEILDKKLINLQKAGNLPKEHLLTIGFEDRKGRSWSIDVEGKIVEAETGDDLDKIKLTTFIAN